MKKFISLFLSVILTLSLISTTACAEQKESYTQIFEKDKVIDINIDIDDSDLEDIRNYPQNEEYHSADITVDGITAVKTMRSNKISTPVIFLTAKDSIDDRVMGLDAGAEDYLVKPFAFAELLARLRALTRRSVGNNTNIYTAADLTLDTKSKTVRRGDTIIPLTAKEYDILEYLMYNKGIILSREKIENHVWNFDYSGGTNVVDVYIRYLRKKIDAPYEKKLIQTVRGFGYMIEE